VSRVLNGKRGDISKRRDQLQMIRVEANSCGIGVQVHHSQHLVLHFQRHREHGMHLPFEEAICFAVSIVTLHVVGEHRDIVLQNPIQDRLAGTNRLVGSQAAVATYDRSKV
jgi:hypothetical protein